MCWCSKCLNLFLLDSTWLWSATNTGLQECSTNHIHPLWSPSSVCVTGNVTVSVFQTRMCSRCFKNKDKIINCHSTCIFLLCATNYQINQFHLSDYSQIFLVLYRFLLDSISVKEESHERWNVPLNWSDAISSAPFTWTCRLNPELTQRDDNQVCVTSDPDRWR